MYIGTAESLYRRLTRPVSVSLKSFPFGKTAAFYRAALDTGLLAALDRALPRRQQDGLSVAQLLFLQIVGRVERPLSRDQMEEWFPRSSLPWMWNLSQPVSSQTLRRYLRRLFDTGRRAPSGEVILSRKTTHRIEEEVFRTLLQQGIDPRWLLFDTTNFFTYHRGGRFPKKGHSKERRGDKNITGLGLVTAGPIPVLSETYPGQETDPEVFARVFDELVRRLTRLEVRTERLALVVDRGVNSIANFEEILGVMHVIGALNRQEARELFTVPLSRFEKATTDRQGKAILGYSTTWTGLERTWRVLVTYRAATARHQERRWQETRTKVLEQVERWRSALARGAPGRSERALIRKLVELIPKDYHAIFDYGVERREGKLWPRCTIPPEAEERLRRSWGKAAIITDLPVAQLSDAELVEGYVARAEIEDDWKWLKDRYVLSVKPVWVWNDAAIPGHIFLCVMGLMLLRYLQWRTRERGLSVPALLDSLGGIRLIVAKDPAGKPQLLLESIDWLQGQLISDLGLMDLVPH